MSKSIFHEVKYSAAILTFSRIFSVVSAFLFNALISRIVSQAEVGNYFLILNVVTFLAIFSRLGLENVVLKMVSDFLSSKRYLALKRALKMFFVYFLLSSLLASLLSFCVLNYSFNYLLKTPNLSSFVPILCLWFVGLSAQLIIGQILRAFKKFWSCSLFGGPLFHTLNLIALLSLSLSGANVDLYRVVKIVVFNLLLLDFISLFWVLHAISGCRIGEEGKMEFFEECNYGRILNLSIPLFVSQVFLFISSQSDIWLLSAYMIPEDVALYGAAAKLVLLTGLTLSIANGILPPFIADFRVRGDIKGLENVVRKVTTVASMPALMILFVFMCFPDIVMSLVFTSKYAGASSVLRVLSVGQIFNVIVGSCGYVLIMFGFNRMVMQITVFYGISMVMGIIIVLEAGYGLMAVAFVNAIVMSFQQLTFLLVANRKCSVLTFIKISWR